MDERCSKHRVARLMRPAGQRSHTGYKRRPGKYGGRPAVILPNHLKRQFEPAEPNKVWATDITYILTHEGCLHFRRLARFVLAPGGGLVNEGGRWRSVRRSSNAPLYHPAKNIYTSLAYV